MFQTAKESLVGAMGIKEGNWITVISFFAGIAIIALIDKFVPEVNVDIKLACGNAKGASAPVIDNWLESTNIVPVTTTTPTILAIMKKKLRFQME